MNTPFTYLVNSAKNESDFISGSEPIYQSVPEDKYISFADKDNQYHCHYRKDVASSSDAVEFNLHYHTIYEIFVYVGGRAKFRVGTAEFRLNPYDIIIVPPYTVHAPIPKKGEMFERYVFNIFPNFFTGMDCTEYLEAFDNLSHPKYKIPGHSAQRSGIIDILNFISKEYDSNSKLMRPMVSYKIAELLYVINISEHFEEAEHVNDVVEDMITYIDKNFDSISLVQDVTDNFFYSKNYLCKLFKKSTGITLPRYINMKKMENVEKLYKSGKSLTHACIESGFSGYNNFAYIYKSEFGVSPRKGMAKETI